MKTTLLLRFVAYITATNLCLFPRYRLYLTFLHLNHLIRWPCSSSAVWMLSELSFKITGNFKIKVGSIENKNTTLTSWKSIPDVSFQDLLCCRQQRSLLTFKPSLNELMHCWLSWSLQGKGFLFRSITVLFMATGYSLQRTDYMKTYRQYIHTFLAICQSDLTRNRWQTEPWLLLMAHR